MSLTAIIPTYRSPEYLDLCLKSATQGRERSGVEITVIIDGYVEESMPVVEKYEDINVIPFSENKGMSYAINVGVYNAETPFVFVLNDDNIFGPKWDEIADVASHNRVVTVNQIEPAAGIYGFVVKDFGRTADTFDFEEWWKYEPTVSSQEFTENGRIFPFIVSKKVFMNVGGFDLFYDSPFFVDLDFFLKLEMLKTLSFVRWHGNHLYHFGSIATKNRTDAEAMDFRRSEPVGAAQFQYKWGFMPDVVNAAKFKNNSKLPLDKGVKGIKF